MKLILFSGLILISANGFCASPNLSQFLSKAPCSQKLSSLLTADLAKQTWFPVAISEANQPMTPGISFRDTVAKKAYRIWSQKDESNLEQTDLKSGQQTTTVLTVKSACEIKKTESKADLQENAEAGFHAADLDKLLAEKGWGVIYLWTPYMPLSVQGLATIKQGVKEVGSGKVTVVMDANAFNKDSEAWVTKGLVQKSELQRLYSREILARNVTLHFPVILLYKDGFLSNRTFVGFKPADAYKQWIEGELAEIAKDRK
jgi:hypothetical protein